MENKIPADCKKLASMLMEMEELVNFVYYRNQVKDEFKYIIYSQRLTNKEQSNQWEDITEQLKNELKKENAELHKN